MSVQKEYFKIPLTCQLIFWEQILIKQQNIQIEL